MAPEMTLVEGGIARLQSPAGLGHGIGGVPRELFSLWRVGALLLLAAIATYGNLIARVRLLLRRFHSRSLRKSDVLPQPPQPYCSSDDDDTWPSVSDDEEEELPSAPEDEPEEENGPLMMRQGFLGDYEDGGKQSGGFDLRGGREVVKTWGGEDLRFRGPSSALGCVISLCDLHRGEVVRSFTAGPVAAACVASTQPSVMLSATDTDFGCRLELHVWDSRVAGGAPSALADLSPRMRRRVKHLGGAGKVAYVGDGAGSAAAVDLRTVRSPMRSVAEEEAAWWDADAVVWEAATSPISS